MKGDSFVLFFVVVGLVVGFNLWANFYHKPQANKLPEKDEPAVLRATEELEKLTKELKRLSILHDEAILTELKDCRQQYIQSVAVEIPKPEQTQDEAETISKIKMLDPTWLPPAEHYKNKSEEVQQLTEGVRQALKERDRKKAHELLIQTYNEDYELLTNEPYLLGLLGAMNSAEGAPSNSALGYIITAVDLNLMTDEEFLWVFKYLADSWSDDGFHVQDLKWVAKVCTKGVEIFRKDISPFEDPEYNVLAVFGESRFCAHHDSVSQCIEMYTMLEDHKAQTNHTIFHISALLYNRGWANFFSGNHSAGIVDFTRSYEELIRTWKYPEDVPSHQRQIIYLEDPKSVPGVMEVKKILPTKTGNYGFLPEIPKGAPAFGAPYFGYHFAHRPLSLSYFENVNCEVLSYCYNDKGQFFVPENRIVRYTGLHVTVNPAETVTFEEILLPIHYTDNYYHYTIQFMSMLSLLQDQGFFDEHPDLVITLSDDENHLFQSSIDKIGLGGRIRKIKQFTRRMHAKKVYYASWDPSPDFPLLDIYFYHLPSYDGLISWRNKLVTEPLPLYERNKIIYLARRLTGGMRGIHPDIDGKFIQDMKARFGDKFVMFESRAFTPDEQKQLFQSARIVVGPHGAALSNVLYCAPGTVVIEMPTSNPVHSLYFSHLASALDLKYYITPNMTAPYYSSYEFTHKESDELVTSILRLISEGII